MPTARSKRGPLQVKSLITRKASVNYWDPTYYAAQSLKINQPKRHKNTRDNSTLEASLDDSFHKRPRTDSSFTCPGTKKCQGAWKLKSLSSVCGEAPRPSYFHHWGQLHWLLRMLPLMTQLCQRPEEHTATATLQNHTHPLHWGGSSSPRGTARGVSKRWHAYACPCRRIFCGNSYNTARFWVGGFVWLRFFLLFDSFLFYFLFLSPQKWRKLQYRPKLFKCLLFACIAHKQKPHYSISLELHVNWLLRIFLWQRAINSVP